MVEYKYDAWGNHTVSGTRAALGELNQFRYRGYYYNTETGLYYLQTRYYDPETGRFMTVDSINFADPKTLNGLNLYAYCGNNPVMYVDPTGTLALTISLVSLLGLSIIGYIESQFHPIQNTAEAVGDLVSDLVEEIITNNQNQYSPNASIETSKLAENVHIDVTLSTKILIVVDLVNVATNNIVFYNPHLSNKSPSKRNKHEKGQATNQRNKPGGEKGDRNRRFRRNGKNVNPEIIEILRLLIIF